jgi:hypothetical protein
MTPIDFEERERMLMRILAQITERKVNSSAYFDLNKVSGFLYWYGHYRVFKCFNSFLQCIRFFYWSSYF